jgi:Protein of unknown function (DUF998)
MASTTLSPSLQARKPVAGMATVAQVGVASFALIIVALHFLRPDLNPISRPTSEYAVGPYNFLMTSAFFSMSVASLALVVALYQGVPPAARSRAGLVLLGAWAVGVLIAMIFPMDAEGAPQTISGAIHQTDGPPTFLSLTIGMILVSWRFKHSEKWRPLYRPALVLSVVFLAAFLGTFLSFVTGTGLLGLAQRIALATAVIWMILVAARLRSAALDPVSV